MDKIRNFCAEAKGLICYKSGKELLPPTTENDDTSTTPADYHCKHCLCRNPNLITIIEEKIKTRRLIEGLDNGEIPDELRFDNCISTDIENLPTEAEFLDLTSNLLMNPELLKNYNDPDYLNQRINQLQSQHEEKLKILNDFKERLLNKQQRVVQIYINDGVV